MSLKESGEMYLESIYVLCKSKTAVRSIDIADYMNFSKPSVSRGVALLKKQGYIIVDKDGYISLTDEGAKTAENACRIEHVISEKTFDCIKKYFESL